MLFEENELTFNNLSNDLFIERQVTVMMMRLDQINPIVSGNKLFKLHFFLEESLNQNHKPILTFGGAYSNHLVATAYACKLAGIKSIGIVRGERTTNLSQTLKECERYGMQLHFVSRELYKTKEADLFLENLKNKFGSCLIIPEGGYHPKGAAGAAIIMDRLSPKKATHVCSALGTATTLAGLLTKRINNETIIGVPVLKNMNDISERLLFLGVQEQIDKPVIFNEYHFGGYAKKTSELIQFMNSFYLEYHIPTDFVYTAKMMYGILDKIKAGYFEAGSKIICLHTGGLQGNDSLPAGTLVF